MEILFAALCAIEAFVFVILAVIFIRRSRSMDIFHRLRRHYVDNSKRLKQTEDIILRISKFIKRMAKPIADLEISKKMDFRLKQAGIPLFGAEFIIMSIIGSILGAIIIYIVTLNLAAVPVTAIGIPMLMWLWASMAYKRRRDTFTNQLSDCLTTVSNALRAGYSFQQAMDVIAKEMEPPMSTEFERVSTDIAMGVSLEDALQQMNHRIGSQDFDLVVTAVLIQREIGGNLAQILDTISFTINDRVRMKREIKALTAQGKFSAWVLMALPFAVGAFCWIFNNDQMQLFITEDIGRIAITIAIVMALIGFVMIQKIVDIEV